VFTYPPAEFRILVGDLAGLPENLLPFRRQAAVPVAGSQLPFHGPGKVAGRGPGLEELGCRCLHVPGKALVRRGLGRKVHAEACRRSDQPGAAHMHFPDGPAHLFEGAQLLDNELVRQVSLIDDPDDSLFAFISPDGAVRCALNLHPGFLFRKKV